MNTLPVAADHNFLGLVELDHAGTVLYSRPEGDGVRAALPNICGSNYYTDVVPFENVEEFHELLTRFVAGDYPAESFIFDCRCHGGGCVTVRVLLARMRQLADGSRVESMLVRIRKV